MAARDPVNYAAVVASIGRGPVDESVAAETSPTSGGPCL
jgi:hypothetical protein